jgi:endonuclease YncB( thermonuclease family)
MWEYRAALIRVIDADTIVVLADTGFGGRQEEHVRLLGVSAPELKEPGGADARQYTLDWCARLPAVRWPLRLATVPNTVAEPDERRTLTRYLGVVSDGARGLNADLALFLAGHPEWGTGR